MKLPDSFADLFRNYDFTAIDDERHSKLVVKTVLAYGTWEKILWLFKHYGEARVREIFVEDYRGLRTLPEATRNLWKLLFIDEPLESAQAVQEDTSRESRIARWRCRRLAGNERRRG